jgi:hypothetical protein
MAKLSERGPIIASSWQVPRGGNCAVRSNYLQRTLVCVEQTTEGITLSEIQRRGRPGGWSVAEILEHLARAFGATVLLLERQLAIGAGVERQATWPEQIRTLIVVRAGYFPKGKSASPFTRPKGADPELALSSFRQALAGMDESLACCEERFGSRAKVAAHPALGPLTSQEWRKFHWIHSRHHARQIAKVRGFPRPTL